MLDLMKATVTMSVGGAPTEREFYFLSNSENYENTGQFVGIVKAEDEEQDNPPIKVEVLQGKGILFRLSCRLEDDSVRQVLCTRDKLLTALDGELIDVEIDGLSIDSVVLSRKAKFS